MCHNLGMYRRLIIFSAILGSILFTFNFIANKFYWYTSITPFDMYMHTLGGIFVAVVAGAFLSKDTIFADNKKLFIILSLFVFIVGLGWEYYEYIVQFYIKGVHLADLNDSISDLLCDMLGGVIGFFFVLIFKKRYNK